MFKAEWFVIDDFSGVSAPYNNIFFDLYQLEDKHAQCLSRYKNTRSFRVAKELGKRLNRYKYQHSKLRKELKELQLLELITTKG